jgi:hypothetical protein
MGYALLADIVVALHLAYVSFVLFGQLAVCVGWLRGWHWVRNPWFRVAHLLAITVVAAEAVLALPCPLTVWEDRLRELAGQPLEAGSFIGRLLHDLLFYEFAPWVFTTCYVGFALLVLATFWLVPPRFVRGRRFRLLAGRG